MISIPNGFSLQEMRMCGREVQPTSLATNTAMIPVRFEGVEIDWEIRLNNSSPGTTMISGSFCSATRVTLLRKEMSSSDDSWRNGCGTFSLTTETI